MSDYHRYEKGTPKKNWRRCLVCGQPSQAAVHRYPVVEHDDDDDDGPIGAVGTLEFHGRGWQAPVPRVCSLCETVYSGNRWWFFCEAHLVVLCDPCSMDPYREGGSHRFDCRGGRHHLWEQELVLSVDDREKLCEYHRVVEDAKRHVSSQKHRRRKGSG